MRNSFYDIELRKYYLVTWVYSKENNKIFIYQNNNLITEEKRNLDGELMDYLILGNFNSTVSNLRNGINGIIDEVRFYDRILSENEITSLYENIVEPLNES